MKSMTEIFEEIYQTGSWVTKHNNPSSLSGPESFSSRASEYYKFLNQFLSKNFVKSVVDYGCGDTGLYDEFDWKDIQYTGIDVSQTAIDRARKRHPDKTFICEETLTVPSADLLIVKDVFGHWNGEKSTVGLGNQRHKITEFLNINQDKFRCILIVDGGNLSEYFPPDFKYHIQEVKFLKKTKTIHIKE
jgi:SAM-dependent methyltransferase